MSSTNLPCVLVSLKDSSWEAFLNKHEFYGLYKDGAPADHILLTADDLFIDNDTLENYTCLNQDVGRLVVELDVMARYENKKTIDEYTAKILLYRSIIQRAVNLCVVDERAARKHYAVQEAKKIAATAKV